MIQLILIFIGGGAGSICRYLIGKVFAYNGVFPWGTMAANIISCLILGIVMALISKEWWTENTRMLMAVGFCGGFSTFSTFSLETFELLKKKEYLLGFLNISGSVIVCVICIFIGFWIIQQFK